MKNVLSSLDSDLLLRQVLFVMLLVRFNSQMSWSLTFNNSQVSLLKEGSKAGVHALMQTNARRVNYSTGLVIGAEMCSCDIRNSEVTKVKETLNRPQVLILNIASYELDLYYQRHRCAFY